MTKSEEIIERLKIQYPMCAEHNKVLFNEMVHHSLIMENAAESLGVPVSELIDFFYKGKLKLELIKEQEEVLQEYVR